MRNAADELTVRARRQDKRTRLLTHSQKKDDSNPIAEARATTEDQRENKEKRRKKRMDADRQRSLKYNLKSSKISCDAQTKKHKLYDPYRMKGAIRRPGEYGGTLKRMCLVHFWLQEIA